jgi:hypothetical protein
MVHSYIDTNLKDVIPEFINCGEATKFMDIRDPGAK